MNGIEERFLIYTALLLVCSTAGVFVGWQAALWTLVQMACVVELVYWLGRAAGDATDESTTDCIRDYRA